MLTRRALIAAIAVGVPAARAAPLAPPPDIARILARGRLLVATAIELPPYVVTAADGAPAGSDIALAGEMAAALGVGVDFRRAITPDAIIELLGEAGADLAIARLSVTLARGERVRFSRPYLRLDQALLLNRLLLAKGAPDGDALAAIDRTEATVAVVAGSGYGEFARRRLSHARLVEFPRWQPDVVGAVLAGTALAGFSDGRDVEAALASTPDAPLKLRRLLVAGEGDAVAVALPPSSLQLLAWVDLFLAMRPSATEHR